MAESRPGGERADGFRTFGETNVPGPPFGETNVPGPPFGETNVAGPPPGDGPLAEPVPVLEPLPAFLPPGGLPAPVADVDLPVEPWVGVLRTSDAGLATLALDRLDRAGLIARTKHDPDEPSVTLLLVPDSARRAAEHQLGPVDGRPRVQIPGPAGAGDDLRGAQRTVLLIVIALAAIAWYLLRYA